MSGPAPQSRRRRIARTCLALAAGLFVVAVGLELGVRFLARSDARLAQRFGARFRQAQCFADPAAEDDFWKLQFLFIDPAHRRPAINPDPLIGWTGPAVERGTYAPVPAPDLAGRTPVLLYGDSFAACNTPLIDCWPGLMERSALAERYCLVDYGVGGYGADQEYLLLRASIDRWKDLDPIVIVSFLVDDDFNRSLLHFRSWPKTRSSVSDGRLVCTGPPTLDPDAYVEAEPVSFKSYLLRFLAFGPVRMPAMLRRALRPDTARLEERKELALATLAAIRAELDARGVRWFFLAFHGQQYFQGQPDALWAEALLRDFAAEHGIPWISTEPYLRAASGGDIERLKRFYGGTPRLAGHYNRVGNLVAFQALAAGIEGNQDGVDAAGLRALVEKMDAADYDAAVDAMLLDCRARVRRRGPTALARMGKSPYPPFGEAQPVAKDERRPYLLLRPGEQGPTEVLFFLDGNRTRFTGRAVGVQTDASAPPAELYLGVRVDGRVVRHERVPPHPGGIDLDVDVRGASRLELVADRGGEGSASAWIHVQDARLESIL